MDLRSIINTDLGDRPVPPKQITPITPIQAHPQQVFREYTHHPSHASPGKHPSQDYGSQPPSGSYASPKPYPGNYSGRPPPPPPIQAPPQNEIRSPVRQYATQSPYQHTPSSSLSTGQYPFPQNHQTPQSPAQHQQHYPPSFQQRDIYANPNPPQHHPHQGSHTRTSPAPQTPPIGMPGAPHPSYLQHQRSQSSVSVSTPTSVQSQPPPHFNPYQPQDSPISAGQYPHSQTPLPARTHSIQSQHSQPGTPLGPPLRQPSGVFVQPTSPYQQRGIPQQPFSNYQQTSPAPGPQRLPSTPVGYDSRRASSSEHHSRSQSSRERSLSVSPKTRLPSQPRGDMPPYPQPDIFSPTKRKMEDVEMPIEAPRQMYQPEVKQEIKEEVNGNDHRTSSSTASPQQPPRKRIRYVEPPIWAQSVRKHVGNRGAPKLNGKPHMPSSVPTSAPVKVETNGHRQPSPYVRQEETAANGSEPHPSVLLGPWEQSISGIKPMSDIVKQIADFIFINVIQRNDLGELSSNNVEIEIEAKLGQFIDQGTRIRFPITTEAIFAAGGDIRFQSAMTEQQHRVLNDFLNTQVKNAFPGNPVRGKKRVPIEYHHRREHDRFYALPRDIFNTLPPAVKQQHNPNHSSKIRVTYDQKSNQILAKIIKVRIADLNISLPRCPLDCRISINFELKYDGDIDHIIAESSLDRSNDRSKDRLSYTQGNYQVDLTQVSKTRKHNGVDIVEKEHELEIELNSAMVREQGQRILNGQPDEYQNLIEGFMDNIRVLARAVPPSQ